jgi:hypothetical protein
VAAKQLINHYKAEAERLLTLTQKSKAVAKSNKMNALDRENTNLKTKMLEMKEQMLELQGKEAVGARVRSRPARNMRSRRGVCVRLVLRIGPAATMAYQALGWLANALGWLGRRNAGTGGHRRRDPLRRERAAPAEEAAEGLQVPRRTYLMTPHASGAA